MNAEINYTIEKKIAVLNAYNNGWVKELNVVAWNDLPPKYDIRDWNADHTRMSKGITLTPEEFELIGKAFVKLTNAEEPKVEDKPKVEDTPKEKPAKKAKKSAGSAKYTKKVQKIIDRMMQAKTAGGAKVDDTYIYTDGYKMFCLSEQLVEVKEDKEVANNLEIVFNANTKTEYVDYMVDVDDLKAYIKEKGYRATSTKVEPYILESDGVKVGVNPIYLRDAIEVIGTNKINLPKTPTMAIMLDNGTDKCIVCPIRLKG